jgi:hypothetical protein
VFIAALYGGFLEQAPNGERQPLAPSIALVEWESVKMRSIL